MSTQPQPFAAPDELVADLAHAGRAAQRELARMDDAGKAAALRSAGAGLRAASAKILAANARDFAAGEANGLTPAMLDQLRLDDQRLDGIASAVEAGAALAQPG